VSAKQKLSPPQIWSHLFPYLLAGILFLCAPDNSYAETLEDAARALARKVANALKGATTTLERENISDLGEKRFSALSLAFQDEMQHRGVKLLPSNGNVKVHLTISNNASEFLGVARIERNDSPEVFIEPLGQSSETIPRLDNEGLTLRRELILSSEQPILDLVFPDENPNRIEVLEPRQVTSYQRDGDRWIRGASLKLPRNGPMERDLRGQLSLGLDVVTAVFPKEICNLSLHDGDQCHPNKEQLNPSEIPENLLEDKELPPWITATQFLAENKNVLLFAGRDGKLRFYADNAEPFATVSTFGDQVTGIRTNCATGWQALVTLKGDWSNTDSVQGMEVRDSKPAVVTQSLQFDGPVLSLQSAESSLAAQPSSAIAIAFNLRMGFYEAYRLTVTCAR
jgi:hypothetical protein